jgi:hypothetical protein
MTEVVAEIDPDQDCVASWKRFLTDDVELTAA